MSFSIYIPEKGTKVILAEDIDFSKFPIQIVEAATWSYKPNQPQVYSYGRHHQQLKNKLISARVAGILKPLDWTAQEKETEKLLQTAPDEFFYPRATVGTVMEVMAYKIRSTKYQESVITFAIPSQKIKLRIPLKHLRDLKFEMAPVNEKGKVIKSNIEI